MMARVEMNEVVVMEKIGQFKGGRLLQNQLVSYHLGDAMTVVVEESKRDGIVYAIVLDNLGYPTYLTPVQIIRAQTIQVDTTCVLFYGC